MPSNFKKLLQRYRVFSGFLLAVVYFVFARPDPYVLAIGLPFALLGIGLRAWACGHLRKSAELDTSGPYAYTRNPLYLGTFIIAIGFGAASGVWWLFALIVIFILSIYLPVMNVEAEVLEQRLGEEYSEYAREVPLIIPRLSPWKKSGRKFSFELYLKNGEHQAAIGFAVASLILVAKSVLIGWSWTAI